jgi:hypothetical protein
MQWTTPGDAMGSFDATPDLSDIMSPSLHQHSMKFLEDQINMWQTDFDDALHPDLSELRKAMAAGDVAQCYKLVKADQRSMVTITPCLVDQVVSMVVDAGATSITSVGCGSGLFEWFLAKKLGQPVYGIEPGKLIFMCEGCKLNYKTPLCLYWSQLNLMIKWFILVVPTWFFATQNNPCPW